LAVNPLQSYAEARQARENPRGYSLSKLYGSSIAKSDSYTPTGKTNLANAVRGFLGTGDFVGAVLGFGSNALSITGKKTNPDGTITKTTYATPFSLAGAYANPIGFGVSTLYGAEMSRSTNFTATGHTNIANTLLGGLAFGPIGAIVGAIANLLGGLFGRKSSKSENIDTTKLSATNTFSSPTYMGFGSNAYAESIGIDTSSFSSYTGLNNNGSYKSYSSGGNGLGGGRSTSSLSGGASGQGLGYGASNTGYSGYGAKGYSGFGSDSWGNSNIGNSTSSNKGSGGTSSSNSGKSANNRSNTQPSYGNNGESKGRTGNNSGGGTSIGGGSGR
jgi:hypothetical protein